MLDIILLVIFTVFFAWVAWWKIDWAIVLVILFVPTYLLRFELFSIPMTILEIMVLVVFVIWIVKALFLNKESWNDRCKNIWWPWQWLTVLFVLVGIIAVIISPDTRQALGLWKAYILEPVIFFVIFVNVIKTKKHIHSILWALGALTVLVGYVTMLQYLNIISIPGDYGLEIPKRATSFFPFPTAVGKLIGPIVALFIGIWMVNSKLFIKSLWEFVKNNLFLAGGVLFGMMGLIFSFSRGALLGVLVAILFISFFSKWKKWILLSIGLLIIVSLLITPIRNNVTDVFNAKDTSTDVRLVMWKGAVRIIEDNPILGTGLASFPIVYEDYKEASHVEYFPNPDHFILSIWIEMGLAGLILFSWIIIKYFRSLCLVLKNNKPLAVGLMAAMIALLIHGFFDTPYFKNDLAIIFWVLIGLTVVLKRQSQEVTK
ncbi:MAG: O-antigen ligase family protein [Candidatus Kerfeldbacteria bacterium]|jgi:O-antigen ligase